MKKGLDLLFSKEELKCLKIFAKNAVIEDRRLHGIRDNQINVNRNNINNINNQTFRTRENINNQPVQQNPAQMPEPPKPVEKKISPPIKKEETSIQNIYLPKPKRLQKEEEKNEPPKQTKKIDEQKELKSLANKIQNTNLKQTPTPKDEIIKITDNSTFHYAKNTINFNNNVKVEKINKVEQQKKTETQKTSKIEQPKHKIEEKKEKILPKPQKAELPNKNEPSKSSKVELEKKVELPKPLPKNLEPKKSNQQTVSSIPKASSPIITNINTQINKEKTKTINNPVNRNAGVPPPPPPPPVVPKCVPKNSINMKLNSQKPRVDREQELKNICLKPVVKENNIDNINNNGDKERNFLEKVLSDAIRDRRKNLHMHDNNEDDNDDNDDNDDWD